MTNEKIDININPCIIMLTNKQERIMNDPQDFGPFIGLMNVIGVYAVLTLIYTLF